MTHSFVKHRWIWIAFSSRSWKGQAILLQPSRSRSDSPAKPLASLLPYSAAGFDATILLAWSFAIDIYLFFAEIDQKSQEKD